jgi:uncharacterized protein YeaO (DUF488 family)
MRQLGIPFPFESFDYWIHLFRFRVNRRTQNGHPMGKAMVRIKRAYDPPRAEDGERILVDRLWPRGMAKESARLASWIREIGPTTELRKWFGHDPSRWEEFRRRYERELHRPDKRAILRDLAERSRGGILTLVYASKDEVRNNAVVLKDLIENAAGKPA